MCNLYSHVKGPKAICYLANAMGVDSASNLSQSPDFPMRGAGHVPAPRSFAE